MNKRSRNSSAMSVAAMFAGLIILAASPAAQDAPPGGKTQDGWVLSIPKRRLAPGPPVTPPSLPVSANAITGATMEMVVNRGPRGRTSTSRQTVVRTADRIHLAGADRSEWLFERNPIDPRRVSATFVEHAAETIVLYAESDLRTALGIRGWVDVLSLGFDSGTLAKYKRTPEARTVGGIQFTRYVPKAAEDRETDIWWSNEQVLSSKFALAENGVVTRFTLESVTVGADASILRPTQTRFPKYRVIDYADWLEKH